MIGQPDRAWIGNVADPNDPHAVFLDGGPGRDHITGGAKPDTMIGRGGWDVLRDDYPNDCTSTYTTFCDYFDGGPGVDRCSGVEPDESAYHCEILATQRKR